MARPHLLVGLLVAVTVISAFWRIKQTATNKLFLWNSGSHTPRQSYTYIGGDFPLRHPYLHLEPATLTLHESIRYGANGSDPVTALEWETLNKYPGGYGRAHLGPERREFLMTFYHQLHCVREIQKALFNRNDKSATAHHVKHCLDYLRQTFLCSAVDTIEAGDFLHRNWTFERKGGELICWDWELVYKELDDDWETFAEWREKWN